MDLTGGTPEKGESKVPPAKPPVPNADGDADFNSPEKKKRKTKKEKKKRKEKREEEKRERKREEGKGTIHSQRGERCWHRRVPLSLSPRDW